MFIIENFVNLINIIYLNLFFLIRKKILKKKIIIFFHPQKKQKSENIIFIENLLNGYDKKKYDVLYFYNDFQNKKNYYLVKERYLNFLFNIDLFINNYITDNFPKNCKKIYIHHNIYDDPWVSKKKEKETCQRLSKYNFIFIATKEAKIGAEKMFKKNKIESPNIIEVGYFKLDYLLKKIKYKVKDSIIIAPTLIIGFSKYSVVSNLESIIKNILKKSNFKIIIRPHPRDRQNRIYVRIQKKYSSNLRISFDHSSNYLEAYTRSKLMITDISGTAYTFAFLTLSPVIFCENKGIKIDSDYLKLNFFKNRNIIGKINKDFHTIDKSLFFLNKNYKTFYKNIINLRGKIKYLNKSKITIKKHITNIINS